MTQSHRSLLIVSRAHRPGNLVNWYTELQNAKDLTVSATNYRSLASIIIDGKLSMFDMQNKKFVTDYDVVDMHNYDKNLAAAVFLHDLLIAHQSPILNPEVSQIWLPDHKLFEELAFIKAGLPVIDTIHFYEKVDLTEALEVIEAQGFTFPLIAKSAGGVKGEQNYLVTSKEMFVTLDFTDSHYGFVVQPFVENDGDYRILLIGDEKPFVFKRTRVGDSHLNNVAQGGSAQILEIDNPEYAELLATAQKARAAMGLEIAGVDVIRNLTTGKLAVMEINYNAAIVNGFNKDYKISLYLKHISKQGNA